jgi:predicted esterase YcpF (UPF0227 family)
MLPKILYVHGYNGGNNNTTAKKIAKELDKILNFEYELIAPVLHNNVLYVQKNIDIINYLTDRNNVKIVICSSFGGFATLFANIAPDIKKIFINPCLYPSIEIAIIRGLSYPELETLLSYEDYMIQHAGEIFKENNIYFISKNDKLFGTDNVEKHINLIKRFTKDNIKLYSSDSHPATNRMLKDICQYIGDHIMENIVQYSDRGTLELLDPQLPINKEDEIPENKLFEGWRYIGGRKNQ